MIRYKDVEKYIVNMFTYLLEGEAEEFGFKEDSTNWVIVERQNSAPMPDVNTVITMRLDDYNNWTGKDNLGQRYGRSTIGYDKYGYEHISELRTFRCIVNVMSKQIGDSFDTARFLIANLQNNRYNNYIGQKGRLLGIESISSMKNLSTLENGTWTERVYFEIKMNFKEEIVLKDHTLFVKVPETLSEVTQSVNITNNVKI